MGEGEKWAANLWVWNRPRDKIDKAKAKARAGLECLFKNVGSKHLDFYWDDGGDLAPQGSMPAGASLKLNTFPNHKFTATLGGPEGERVGSWTMRKGQHSIEVGQGY
jgi:hypothetical protein